MLQPCQAIGNICSLTSECSLSRVQPLLGSYRYSTCGGCNVQCRIHLFELIWSHVGFQFSRAIRNTFKLWCKYKLRLAEHSNGSIQLNHVNLITRLYNTTALVTLDNSSQWKGELTSSSPLLSSAHLPVSSEPSWGSLLISHSGGRDFSPRSSAFGSKMMVAVLHSELMDLMLCPQRKKSMPLSTGLIKLLRRTLTASTWFQWIRKQTTSSRQLVMA